MADSVAGWKSTQIQIKFQKGCESPLCCAYIL